MKLLNLLFIGILIYLSLISCEKNSTCIDSTLIKDSIAYIEIHDPVCGCESYTYDNYCYANKAGITSYVAGECFD